MKRILLTLFICICFLMGCKDAPTNASSNINGNFTYQEKIDSSTTNYQYDINWGNCDVDVRIVTVKGHDYIIATSYVGRAGDVSILHAESCKCKNN